MIRTQKVHSKFLLFTRPSFLSGVARIADPLGRLNSYNFSRSMEIDDLQALRSDWEAVGADLKAAIKQHEQEQKSP